MKITKKSGVELTSEYKIIDARVKKFDKMVTNRLVVLIKRYIKADPKAIIETERSLWETASVTLKLAYIETIERQLEDYQPKQLSLDLNQLQPIK